MKNNTITAPPHPAVQQIIMYYGNSTTDGSVTGYVEQPGSEPPVVP